MITKFIILALLVFCVVLRVDCNGTMMEPMDGMAAPMDPSMVAPMEPSMDAPMDPSMAAPMEPSMEPSMSAPVEPSVAPVDDPEEDPEDPSGALISMPRSYAMKQKPIFSVVGSKTLRADEPYKCAITHHGPIGSKLAQDLLITVGLEGVGFDGQEFSLVQNASVPSGKTQIFKMTLKGLVPGVFNLVARTQSVSKSVQLYFNKQLVSVYIQLSKPVYGISDLIEFRVFVLNSRTKPYKIADTSIIRILDPSNNQIKAWKNPTYKQGLYEGQWQLSEALTGVWTVLVEADGQINSKSFEIHEDLKPSFEIELTTPTSSVSYREGIIKVKVVVKVKVKSAILGSSGFIGELVLTCDEFGMTKYQRTLPIEDEFTMDIDIKNDLGLDELTRPTLINIKADFLEEKTMKIYSATTKVAIELSEFIVKSVHSPMYFKPAIPYSFTLAVTKLDDYPVLNSETEIEVVVTDDDGFKLVEGNFTLEPNTGTIDITASGISLTASYLKISARYDSVKYFEQIVKTPTFQKEFVSLHVLTAKPQIYKQMDLQVKTTEDVSAITFQIFSKGLMKKSLVIPVTDKIANFNFTPKFSHTPRCHMIAFYVAKDGQMVSDSMTLRFDYVLPNFVNVSLASSEAKPGANFTFNVTSTMNSSVSLLAIDQRVLSYRSSGYDIEKNYVFEHELIKYDQLPVEVMYDSEIPFWYYHDSYQKKFIDVGAVILTNAKQDIPCKASDDPSTIPHPINNTIENNNGASIPSALPPGVIASEYRHKKFLETFLFKTLFINTAIDEKRISGQEICFDKAPDSITSWLITAVSVSEKFGLGLTNTPAILNVFMYFYIEFNVPKSIKEGETAILEMLVVNLLEEDQDTEVKFFNELDQFDVIRAGSYNWTLMVNGHTQRIVVKRKSIYRLRIEVRAKKFGNVDLTVQATTPVAGDRVTKPLLVIPEGLPTYNNHAEFIHLTECDVNGKDFELECEIPTDAVNDTIQVQSTVVGDILGSSLSNLESLIRMPAGCGEQTMITFAPNVLVLDYLTLTNQLTKEIKTKAVQYLEQGYQRMLKYKHPDGGFSAFGMRDKNSSTWLTSYAVKYFRRALKYIDIDETVLKDALAFIVSKQLPTGQFKEDGIVFHKSLQSGTGAGIAFSSYVTIVIFENLEFYPQYSKRVDSAIEFIDQNYDPKDTYSLAIATYAFYLVNVGYEYELLEQLTTSSVKTPAYVYWKNQPVSENATSLDVEITAYGLLIFNQIPEFFTEGVKVLQWLTSQQNSKGGWFSTQDTIQALEAISKFATKFKTSNTNLQITIHPNSGANVAVSVNRTTALTTQSFSFQSNVRKVQVSAKGNGFAVVQLSCNYFLNKTLPSPKFNISVKFDGGSCDSKLIMKVCASFITRFAYDKTNMVIVKIELPSGFVYDTDTDVALSPEIMKVEQQYGGTSLVVYLNSLSAEQTCFTLILRKTQLVMNLKSSNIEIYDYYDTSRKASSSYKPPLVLRPCFNSSIPTLPPIPEFTVTETLPGRTTVSSDTSSSIATNKPSEVTKGPALPGGVTKEPTLPGGVTKEPAVPGGVTKEPIVPGGVTKEPAVPGGITKEPAVPGGITKEPAVPGGMTKEPAVPGEVTKEPAVPGGVTKEPTIPGGVTKEPAVPGGVTKEPALPGGVTKEPTIPGGVTKEPAVPGGVTKEPAVPGGVTKEPAVPGGVTKEPTIPGGVTKEPAVPGGVTKEPTIPGGVTKEPTLPGGVTKEPTIPGGVTKEPAVPGGVTKEPTLPGGVTKEPAVPGGVTKEPAVSGEVTKEPTIPGGVTKEPTIPGGVTKEPTLPGGVTKEPTIPGGVTKEPAVSGGVTKEPAVPGGVTKEPAVPGEVTKEPTIPGGVTKEPTIPGGVTKEPAVPGGVTKEPTIPGGVTKEPTLPGGVTKEPTIPGGVTKEPAVPGGVTKEPTLPGGVTKEPAVPGGVTKEPAVSGEVTKEPTIPGGVTKEPTIPGGVTKEPAVPGGVTKEPAVPGEVTKEPAVPGGVTKEPALPGGVTKEPTLPGGVTKEPSSPGEVTKEPALPGGVTKEPIVPGGVTKEPTIPGGITKEPALPGGVTKEPSSPGEVTKEPALPGGVTKEPIVPGGVTKEPTIPGGITKEPALPGGVTKEPTLPGGVTKEPAVPGGVTKEPTLPGGITKEPALPGGVTKEPTLPGGVTKEPPVTKDTTKVTKTTTAHTRPTLNGGGISTESGTTLSGEQTVSSNESSEPGGFTGKVTTIKSPTGVSEEPVVPSEVDSSEETTMNTHYTSTTTSPIYDGSNTGRPRSRRPVRPLKSSRYGNANGKNMKRRKIKKMTSTERTSM